MNGRTEPRYRDVNCVICGTVFRTNWSRSKYCSNECRNTARRDIYSKWKVENKSKLNGRNRSYMRKRRNGDDDCEDEIEKPDNLARIAQEYDTNYGKYQREKTLAEIPKIDVEGIISGFKKKGDRKNEIHV